jgi:diaminopimelate epimerase
MIPFLKMHGLGNDFVVFDARKREFAPSEGQVRAIADRHLGVGCDQLIVIEQGRNGFEAAMRSMNADGTEAESCGNASRCVARLLMEELGKPEVALASAGGPLFCRDAGRGAVTVDMGAPAFEWEHIPLAKRTDTKRFPLSVGSEQYVVSAVSVGNPHCVLFVDEAEAAPVATLGPVIETHAMFPKRTNVEFASVYDRGHIRMRVWERGTGVTTACGTGACATAAASHRLGLSDRKVKVALDGGELEIELRAHDGHVLMTGPAVLSFRGELDLAAFQ